MECHFRLPRQGPADPHHSHRLQRPGIEACAGDRFYTKCSLQPLHYIVPIFEGRQSEMDCCPGHIRDGLGGKRAGKKVGRTLIDLRASLLGGSTTLALKLVLQKTQRTYCQIHRACFQIRAKLWSFVSVGCSFLHHLPLTLGIISAQSSFAGSHFAVVLGYL